MFREATDLRAANSASLYAQLESRVSLLDETAEAYELNSQAVKSRRIALLDAADLALRVANMSDDEDSAELRIVADNLRYEANELLDVQQDLANKEYASRLGSANSIKFSDTFMDESKSSARLDTDWNVFMSIEPREFVASHNVDTEELKIRAASFMDNVTAGHGLSRKAKMNLTAEFISRISSINDSKVYSDKKEESEQDFDDSDLFN